MLLDSMVEVRSNSLPCALQGSVVRAIRRLEELLRQLTDAMKSVGDIELADHFASAGQCVRRDIIFAASLYL